MGVRDFIRDLVADPTPLPDILIGQEMRKVYRSPKDDPAGASLKPHAKLKYVTLPNIGRGKYEAYEVFQGEERGLIATVVGGAIKQAQNTGNPVVIESNGQILPVNGKDTVEGVMATYEALASRGNFDDGLTLGLAAYHERQAKLATGTAAQRAEASRTDSNRQL